MKIFQLITYIEANHLKCLQKKFINDEDLEQKFKIRFLKLTKREIKRAAKLKKEKEQTKMVKKQFKDKSDEQLRKIDEKKIERKLKKRYQQIRSKLGTDWESLSADKRYYYNDRYVVSRTQQYKKVLKKYFKFLNENEADTRRNRH